MSRKTFLQIAALIIFGGIVYLGAAQVLTWQANRAYEAALKRAQADSDKRAATLVATDAAEAPEKADPRPKSEFPSDGHGGVVDN